MPEVPEIFGIGSGGQVRQGVRAGLRREVPHGLPPALQDRDPVRHHLSDRLRTRWGRTGVE